MLGSWWLIFVHLVLYTSRLSSAQSDFTDILPMLGPRAEVDVVGVLDRSQGVGHHNFVYFVRPFFESLLNQYTAIHRDFARSAVVTFARDVTVAYDAISDPDAAVSKCELFLGPRRVRQRSQSSVWNKPQRSAAACHQHPGARTSEQTERNTGKDVLAMLP